jgi:hypothetical protein
VRPLWSSFSFCFVKLIICDNFLAFLQFLHVNDLLLFFIRFFLI